jgi:hypothetical protein
MPVMDGFEPPGQSGKTWHSAFAHHCDDSQRVASDREACLAVHE